MARRLSRSRPALAALIAAAVGAFPSLPALANPEGPGAKGAQVYCFMRSNGNSHEVSWAAAYALIKRQGAGMFRTSPEHAAVMITEAVVQNPTTFPDCGRFLGDLYNRRVQEPGGAAAAAVQPASGSANPSGTGGMTRGERFGN